MEPTQQYSITSLSEFFSAILALLIIIASLLMVIYLVWGGLAWLTAKKPQQVKNGRERVTKSLVGLGIISLVYAVTVIVGYITSIVVPTYAYITVIAVVVVTSIALFAITTFFIIRRYTKRRELLIEQLHQHEDVFN